MSDRPPQYDCSSVLALRSSKSELVQVGLLMSLMNWAFGLGNLPEDNWSWISVGRVGT